VGLALCGCSHSARSAWEEWEDASPRRRLEMLLYRERRDIIADEVFKELVRLDPRAAARVIHKALTDRTKRADALRCARAILIYRAFDETALLKSHVVYWSQANEVESDVIAARTLWWISCLQPDDRDLNSFCRSESAKLLKLERKDVGTIPEHVTEESFVVLLRVLWLTGDDKSLERIRDDARKIERNFVEKYMPDVTPAQWQKGITFGDNVPDEELDKWLPAKRVQENARVIIEALPFKRRVAKLSGEELVRTLATCYLDDREYDEVEFVRQWLGVTLARRTTPEAGAKAMREALASLLQSEEISEDDKINMTIEACDWIAELGGGLTDADRKAYDEACEKATPGVKRSKEPGPEQPVSTQ